ncbi:MAG: cation transporting ATPase C-terminal domain-containing protein [Christensenellales bacterium]
MTMAFATLCLARLWHGFNSRGKESIFALGLFTNMAVVGAWFAGACLLGAVLLIPVLQNPFTIDPLRTIDVMYVVGLSLIPTIIIQMAKAAFVNSAQHR